MANPLGISVLIVEDEIIVAADLQESLEAEGYNVVGIADNGREALQLYNTENVDLVLQDINIKGDWDGIETSRQLMAVKQRPFIYLTAYGDEDTFNRAKGTHPAAYLLKPFHLPTIKIAIELAFNNFFNRQLAQSAHQPEAVEELNQPEGDYLLHMHNAIFIRHGGRHVKVNLDDILYLSADSNHVQIHTAGNLYTLRRSMQNLLDELPECNIKRVHRSYAVNTTHVEKIKNNMLFIKGQQIPLGRSYKDGFLQHLKVL